jgi:hypothetical protein
VVEVGGTGEAGRAGWVSSGVPTAVFSKGSGSAAAGGLVAAEAVVGIWRTGDLLEGEDEFVAGAMG